MRGARGGFSLVEVVVAMVVLTVGILALATVSGYVTAQVHASDLRTERMLATQAVVEQIRATPWPDMADGTTHQGRYDVTWRLEQVHPSLRRVVITTTGPSYRGGVIDPAVPENVQISVIRP